MDIGTRTDTEIPTNVCDTCFISTRPSAIKAKVQNSKYQSCGVVDTPA
jgi:hypothetical protein